MTRPSYYLGADHPQETIKVIFANGWGPEFCRGSAMKYITRAGQKDPEKEIEDLEKAKQYLDFIIWHLETGWPLAKEDPEQLSLFLSPSGERLAHQGDSWVAQHVPNYIE